MRNVVIGLKTLLLRMNNDHQEILLKLINGYYSLPHEYHQLIFEECETVQFVKQQHLIETGQKNDSEYFLLDGIMVHTGKVSLLPPDSMSVQLLLLQILPAL